MFFYLNVEEFRFLLDISDKRPNIKTFLFFMTKLFWGKKGLLYSKRFSFLECKKREKIVEKFLKLVSFVN